MEDAGLDRASAELRDLLDRVAALAREPLERMIAGSVDALKAGGKLLFAGNGGSAAQCQHLATELVGRFALDRQPHAAMALTTDSSLLTACANDYGFEDVFARQVRALGRPGDVLFALSTGGRSPNVLKAVEAARALGLATYGLTGAGGAALAERCDEAIVVPHADPARIQEVHLLLGHLLCGAIERRLAVGGAA
ncbi:MAG: SIS domain-containing protein [Chloroflexi bacterium]|nr:SIS domain-containing protein [Chloroflexota bacterium]